MGTLNIIYHKNYIRLFTYYISKLFIAGIQLYITNLSLIKKKYFYLDLKLCDVLKRFNEIEDHE